MKKLLGIAAAVAAATYFFDPQEGARRRNMTRDRVLAFFRTGGRKASDAGRSVTSQAYGLKQKATHIRESDKGQPDDVTLARKVETEIFRDADVPKGQIQVNVQEGVVQLRGEVPRADLIDELVAETRKVQGVRDVENLLHVPGAEAPMHE